MSAVHCITPSTLKTPIKTVVFADEIHVGGIWLVLDSCRVKEHNNLAKLRFLYAPWVRDTGTILVPPDRRAETFDCPATVSQQSPVSQHSTATTGRRAAINYVLRMDAAMEMTFIDTFPQAFDTASHEFLIDPCHGRARHTSQVPTARPDDLPERYYTDQSKVRTVPSPSPLMPFSISFPQTPKPLNSQVCHSQFRTTIKLMTNVRK